MVYQAIAYEATSFVRARMTIDTRATLLLLQLSVFGSRMPRLAWDAPSPDLGPLEAALKAIYQETHLAMFVRLATGTTSRRVVETEIGRLASTSVEVVVGSSLFILPLRPR
jgi:hypothetical protein